MRLLFLLLLMLIPFLGVSQETSKVDSLELFFGYNNDVVAVSSSTPFFAVSSTVTGVAGHTCDIGTMSYNNSLGLRRAKAVSTALRGFGFTFSDSVVVSRGELSPAYGVAFRHKNRRVVVYYTAAAANPTGGVAVDSSASSVPSSGGGADKSAALVLDPVPFDGLDQVFDTLAVVAPPREQCYCEGIVVPEDLDSLRVFRRVANAQAARSTGRKAKCWAMFYFIAKGRLERLASPDYSRRFLKQYDGFLRRAKEYNRVQERRSPVSDGKHGKVSQSRKAGGISKGSKPFGKFFREDVLLPIAKGLNRASFCVFGRCLFK